MKDHEIAAIVNELRYIAVQYHGSGQLRERIAHVIVPVLKPSKGDSEHPWQKPDGSCKRWCGDGECKDTCVSPCSPPSTLAQQVASAQAEVATWPDGKLAHVKLAGGDQP